MTGKQQSTSECFRPWFPFPCSLSFRSAREQVVRELGITRGGKMKMWRRIMLVKQNAGQEYWGWEGGGADGKEADENVDFWTGFPNDLATLAATSEGGRLRCRQARGSPGCLPEPASWAVWQREQGGSLSLAAQKIFYWNKEVCLLGGAFGSFWGSTKEFRSYIPHFGLQRSKFDLMPAICFIFLRKGLVRSRAILMTFSANS